jgi:hypothetical protein
MQLKEGEGGGMKWKKAKEAREGKKGREEGRKGGQRQTTAVGKKNGVIGPKSREVCVCVWVGVGVGREGEKGGRKKDRRSMDGRKNVDEMKGREGRKEGRRPQRMEYGGRGRKEATTDGIWREGQAGRANHLSIADASMKSAKMRICTEVVGQ